MVGFHLKRRIWSAAADLIVSIRSRPGVHDQNPVHSMAQEPSLSTLIEAYLQFTGLVANLPSWLRQPESIDLDDDDVAAYQKTCFWAQRSNIMTVFHCMKLVILQIRINCEIPLGHGTQ